MPRRTATPATPAPSAPLPPPPRDLVALAESDPEWAHNIRILRRHWKWANFSQFFYTFAPLLNMSDLFLSDLEDDLARGTNIYIPRIMHRLLYTLSQDRKLNIDNWQTALRRQYLRRNPLANPIGPEPKAPSRESSLDPSEKEEDAEEVAKEEDKSEEESKPAQEAMDVDSEELHNFDAAARGEPSSNPKQEPLEDVKIPEEIPAESDDQLREVEEEESKDWLELPMLDKLDSLHLLTEWQFQNPYRVRQLMKDDDDAANWRIEPIGYDAKTNAYWLIGPDRLWIQRAPPKPPRNRTLKRKRPAAPPKQAARAKVEDSSSDEEEEEVPARSKRTRLQSQSKSRSQNQANGRATRTSRRAAQSSNDSSDLILPGKSSRAAKVQANKKLDVQAKELAEYQRQAARLASAKSRNASPRKSHGASSSLAKRAVGTRVSARLRNSTKDDGEDDDDEEWQQVPEEWLQDATRRSTRTRSKGKQREEPEEKEPEEDEERVAEEQANEEEGESENVERTEGEGEGEGEGEYDGEERKEDEDGTGEDADGDVEKDDLLQKAGLESGSVSDLTDLSDQEESNEDAPPATTPRQSARKGGRRKPSRSTRSTRRAKAPPADPSPSVSNSKSKLKAKRNAQSEPEPEEEDQEMEEPELEPEPPAPAVPEDFVEWETIAVTLTEWEHIADPFAKATHYLERALYKMLTQNIVPIVVEDLREAEKRKRLEAAIVHRKRSSRIALKESEKEEARLAAKKKAEDEEKLARARRQEVRQKKEDAERAKRERAREQRAKEREEREARARAKAERAERDEAVAARSTGTPSVNGTHQSSSIQPSRVVTPNGVRTPDWILDCEVCHKQGVNLDDGKAMVSCASCNRWQHITCHDLHDQRSGRPRRDWDKQQFYCSRCRQRSLNGGLYGGQGYSAHRQQQYAWAQSGQPIHLQKPGGMDPFAHTSDMRYSHRSPVENGAGYSQQQYLSNNVGAAPYPRSSYPNTGFSFNHYQPDQRGLQSRAIPSTPQGSWSSSNGGYGALPDPLATRSPSSPFASQYAHNGSMYASSRVSSGYQNHGPPPHTAQYNDHTSGMSSSRWPSSTSNGYHSPAVQEAAHSLAYMQDGSSSRYSSSAWPAASSYGQLATASSQSHHSSYSHAPAPTGIDPLTGQSFSARVEQHVGHGPPHTNGATSFNYPSS